MAVLWHHTNEASGCCMAVFRIPQTSGHHDVILCPKFDEGAFRQLDALVQGLEQPQVGFVLDECNWVFVSELLDNLDAFVG